MGGILGARVPRAWSRIGLRVRRTGTRRVHGRRSEGAFACARDRCGCERGWRPPRRRGRGGAAPRVPGVVADGALPDCRDARTRGTRSEPAAGAASPGTRGAGDCRRPPPTWCGREVAVDDLGHVSGARGGLATARAAPSSLREALVGDALGGKPHQGALHAEFGLEDHAELHDARDRRSRRLDRGRRPRDARGSGAAAPHAAACASTCRTSTRLASVTTAPGGSAWVRIMRRRSLEDAVARAAALRGDPRGTGVRSCRVSLFVSQLAASWTSRIGAAERSDVDQDPGVQRRCTRRGGPGPGSGRPRHLAVGRTSDRRASRPRAPAPPDPPAATSL